MDLAVLEPIQHGSPEKNIGFYNHVFPGNEHDTWGDFIAHWHAEYEFIYVYQGPVSFILDNKVISVKTGQALFIDKNTIHASITPDISNPHYICVTFGEQFLFPSTFDALYQEYFFPLLSENKQIPSRIKGDSIWEKKILQVLNKLCDSGFNKSRGCELEWRILLLEILRIAYVYDVFVPKKTGNENNTAAVQSAILAIQSDFRNTIQISQLAKETGFSTEHFCRVFKSVTGKTPTEYINAYRLQEAEYLLIHTTDNITVIAISSGFNDINYFSRYFKKIHNVTPSQYRRRYQ